MASALTADEQQRYPWATRISDFVPVGRWRKIGLACVGAAVVILAIGIGYLYLTAENIKRGVEIVDRTIGIGSLGIAGVLVAIAFVIGIVTGIQALIHSAKTPLVWSLACIAPAVLFGVFELLTR
jgi:hypothetical protein